MVLCPTFLLDIGGTLSYSLPRMESLKPSIPSGEHDITGQGPHVHTTLARPGQAPKSTEGAAGARNFSEIRDRLTRLRRISEAANVLEAIANGPTGTATESERGACHAVLLLLEEMSEREADEI